MIELLREFKPSILFLVKFLALYLSLNFVYSVYINYYFPNPDPVTIWATEHTVGILKIIGSEAEAEASYTGPKVWIKKGGEVVLSVFEGCSGLNVAIIFVAFVLSFSDLSKAMLWFIPSGLMIIHLANLTRIGLLYYVTLYFPRYLYYTHKYVFTATLYLVILVLWYFWVVRWMPKPKKEDAAQ